MRDNTQTTGTTADVISVLRLTPLNTATRTTTIKSVRTLREVLSGGPDIPAEEFFAAVEMAFEIEVIVDGRLESGKFLKTSHRPEPRHDFLSPP